MVSTAMHLKEKLASKGISPIIVNARFAKPIDFDMVDYVCKKEIYELVVMEEGVLNGGIGQAIEEYVHDKNYQIKVTLITIPDAYVEHGDVSKLREALGINSDSILKKII